MGCVCLKNNLLENRIKKDISVSDLVKLNENKKEEEINQNQEIKQIQEINEEAIEIKEEAKEINKEPKEIKEEAKKIKEEAKIIKEKAKEINKEPKEIKKEIKEEAKELKKETKKVNEEDKKIKKETKEEVNEEDKKIKEEAKEVNEEAKEINEEDNEYRKKEKKRNDTQPSSHFSSLISGNNQNENFLTSKILDSRNKSISSNSSENENENANNSKEWLEKYNKFLERTSFKNLLQEENPVFSPFKFNRSIIEEINNVRTNLLTYAEKIDNYKKFIQYDKVTKKKYLLKICNLLYLPNGKKGFEECSQQLKKLYEDQKTMKKLKKLTYLHELKFPFPKNEEKALDRDYIDENFKLIKKKFEGIYKIENFFYFKSTSDPEISIMLRIIDQENKGRIRQIFLKDSLRFIGVNFGKLKDGSYLVYLLLAC